MFLYYFSSELCPYGILLLSNDLCSSLFGVILFYDCMLMQAPGTSWMKVLENLDHEGFDIPNMEAFSFLMMVVRSIWKVCFQTGSS